MRRRDLFLAVLFLQLASCDYWIPEKSDFPGQYKFSHSFGEVEIIELKSGGVVEQRFYASEAMFEADKPLLKHRCEWEYIDGYFHFENLCHKGNRELPLGENNWDYMDNHGATLEKGNGRIFICFSDDFDWNYYKIEHRPPAR